MENKNIVIKIFSSLLISILLIKFFIDTSNNISRLILIPFLICSLLSIGKQLFIFLGNQRLIKIFDKLFILSFLSFWFGLLTYVSYIFIKDRIYFPLLFTLPFWLAGFYTIKKKFFVDNKQDQNQKQSHFPIIMSGILISCTLILGIGCLSFGIYKNNKLKNETKDYTVSEAYYKGFEKYNTDSKGKTTYKLIYVYFVNNTEYTIKTEYGVNSNLIPKNHDFKEIKYNPLNPKEAIFTNDSKYTILVFFGSFFTIVALIFLVALLCVKGKFAKLKFNLMETVIGLLLLITGLGIILFLSSNTNSLLDSVMSLKLFALIPIFFVFIGIWLLIGIVNYKRSKNKDERK